MGHLIESAGVLIGIIALVSVAPSLHPLLNLTLLLVAWFSLWFFPHCLAHYLVGMGLGVRFSHYFLGKSSLVKLGLPIASAAMERVPVLGIKVDRRSLDRVSPLRQAVMFASGAAASMVLPATCVIFALDRAPLWVAALLAALTAGNVLFTLYFSPKVGDLSKAARAWKRRL